MKISFFRKIVWKFLQKYWELNLRLENWEAENQNWLHLLPLVPRGSQLTLRRDFKVSDDLICRKFPITGSGMGPGGSFPWLDMLLTAAEMRSQVRQMTRRRVTMLARSMMEVTASLSQCRQLSHFDRVLDTESRLDLAPPSALCNSTRPTCWAL